MKCPHCGEDKNMVMRTDDSTMLGFIRRGRLCMHCREVFETTEKATGAPFFKRKSSALSPSLFDDVVEKKAITAKVQRLNRELTITERRHHQADDENNVE